MPTRRQLIQKITLNANASSVTFSNIPQNYTDLLLISSTRSSEADIVDTLKMTYNGSATGYSDRAIQSSGTAANTWSVSSYTYNSPGLLVSSNATANTFSSTRSYIPNYSGSSNKICLSNSVTENNAAASYINSVSSLWTNTAAITSITLAPEVGPNFVANSTFYLYGITHVPIIRGGEVSIRDGFKYHTFRSTGSLQVIEGGDVEYLILSGGGGGGIRGNRGGGGGGAGGMLLGKTRLNSGTHTAAVGGGGTGSTYIISSVDGQDGSVSSISTISSSGGGGGGGSTGRNGGSGGGGGGNEGASGGTGISGQGFAGGAGAVGNPIGAGGGGGGAGQIGSAGSGSNGGKGGDGRTTLLIGGVSTIVGGGGGGGGDTTAGAAGLGGGGAGGGSGSGLNAVPNTGGGGGGCGDAVNDTTSGIKAGNGGSGIIAIRYPYDGN